MNKKIKHIAFMSAFLLLFLTSCEDTDNEAHVVMKDEIDAGRLDGWNYPARLPAIPGREEITEGVGRHMDGVLQIINGWKEIPIHEKHPHFHTFIKSYDPHLLQIFQDCMIDQDLQ